MLHKETISTDTLGILNDLMQDTNLAEFYLVGGTALSLQIGHRVSVDLDFFTQSPFDTDELLAYLKTSKGFLANFQNKGTLKGSIGSVKVDFIKHLYPMVNKPELIENIRLASLPEISAMKLNAIIGNGTRLKDFVDVAFMSSFMSLNQMSAAYEIKYESRNIMMIIKSISYHADINFEEPIQLMNAVYSWMPISRRITQMIESMDVVWPPLSLLDI